VLVFGESLGAWTSSDVVMFQGIEGFDHYGIDRALWVGLPWLAKWSRSGMARGASTLVPEGTVGVFDRHEQLQELTDEQRGRLRAVILSHDNDPIAVMGPELLIRRPTWLADGQRGRGVPDQMHWRPLITFIQTAMDAANAMVSVPGEFGSFGHDYRADMVRFVRDAYGLPPASEEQLARIEEILRSLELERAQRIKARDPPPLLPRRCIARATAPPGPGCRCIPGEPAAPAGAGGRRRHSSARSAPGGTGAPRPGRWRGSGRQRADSSKSVGSHNGGSRSAAGSSVGAGNLRISTSSRPSDWIRSSRPCSEDWSWTGPCSTVSTGSTVAVRPSNAPSTESLRRPLIRIS
jgi:hypothetical protein